MKKTLKLCFGRQPKLKPLNESLSKGQISIHTKFQPPRPSGSALKVCGGGWVVR